MPGGQPTKYDPAYCQQVIEFMADGYSLTAFAGSIGVSGQTIYNWRDAYPEFFEAVKIGQARAVAFWEQANRKMALTGEGNATACIFGLKNRAKEEWADISRRELTGPDGGPIETDQRVRDDANAVASRISGLAERARAAGMADKPDDGTAG